MGRDVTSSHVTFWMSARLAFLKVRKRPRNLANSTSDRTMASVVVLGVEFVLWDVLFWFVACGVWFGVWVSGTNPSTFARDSAYRGNSPIRNLIPP